MPGLLEKREAGGLRKWLLAGTVAVDWAEMRVLQRFRGVCPREFEAGATITENDIPTALEHIFARERKGFEKSISHLTPTQVAVLKGMAATDSAKIYSSQFLDERPDCQHGHGEEGRKET